MATILIPCTHWEKEVYLRQCASAYNLRRPEYVRVFLAGIIDEFTPDKPLPLPPTTLLEPTLLYTMYIPRETMDQLKHESKRFGLNTVTYCRYLLMRQELPNASQDLAQED